MDAAVAPNPRDRDAPCGVTAGNGRLDSVRRRLSLERATGRARNQQLTLLLPRAVATPDAPRNTLRDVSPSDQRLLPSGARRAARAEVQAASDAEALGLDPDEWVGYLVAKYGMQPIKADFVAIAMEEVERKGAPSHSRHRAG